MKSHRFTCQELIYNLKVDSTLKILFVEGNRDMSFWRKLCPISDRVDSVVYSIGDLEIQSELGGNRGRLINFAKYIFENGFGDRVKVFIDADYDHIMAKKYPSNIVLTDWKDIESYALNEDVISEIVNTGLAKKLDYKVVYSKICEVSCSIGLLRIVSEQNSLDLPFQKTFDKNGRKKFLINNSGSASINMLYLISNLLQNANISLKQRDNVMDGYNVLCDALCGCDVKYIAHGKDWGYFLACFCGVDPDLIESLVFLSLNYDDIKQMDSISFVSGFLTH